MKPGKRTQISLWVRSVLMTILFPGFVAGFVPFYFLLPFEMPALRVWPHFLAVILIGEEYENYQKQVRRWVPGKSYHPAG